MGIKKLFKRVKIKNNNPKILEVISDWLGKRGYDLQEFLNIIRMVGIKAPVMLQSLCFDRDEFTCIDKNNKRYNIEFYRDGKFVKMRISTSYDKREFILKEKENKNDQPLLIFRKRIQKKNSITLISENSIDYSRKTFKINEEVIAIIKCEKESTNMEQAHRLDFSIWEDIEKYLLNLNVDKELRLEDLQKTLREKFICSYISNIEVKKSF